MAESTRSGDGFRSIILSSVRSTGFWSFVAAVVGAVALVTGGVLYLLVEPIRDFAVSVLIIGMVLLFAALVLSPKAVAIFLLGRQGRYGSNVVVMTGAFFAIAILVNFLLYLNPTRLDVTATRVLTLAPQTQQVLNNLDTQVRANAFFVPGDSNSALARRQAEDLLNEFGRNSDNFTYRFIDPQLNAALAEKYNVNSYPSIVFEDMEVGRQQGVQTFTEQSFVTGVLISTNVDQKRVYYLTGHNEAALTQTPTGQMQDNGFDMAIQGMQRDNYRVLPLNLTDVGQVPEDAAALVIAGPKSNLTPDEEEALNEYIMSGGRILALFDPETPDSFVNLLSRWGVTLGQSAVADAVSNVAGEALTPMVQRANSQFFTSSATGGIGIADQLDSAFFPTAAAVQPVLGPRDMPPFIQVNALASTTPASWLEENVEDVSFTPGEDAPGPFFLSVVVQASGTVDEQQFLPQGQQARFVVFGDSDFATNRFFTSMNNADFFLNSVNWLAGDTYLMDIRPKLVPYRELVINAREREFIKWSSWLVPPSLMLVIGAVVWWRRR